MSAAQRAPNLGMQMSDILQWSSALLAMVGFALWCWSVHISVLRSDAVISVQQRKRQLGRYAALAAGLSVLLLAVGLATSSTPRAQEISDVELIALAAPSAPMAMVG